MKKSFRGLGWLVLALVVGCSSGGGNGNGQTAGNTCEYAFDEKASVVTEIRIASLAANGADGNPTDHCCFDFTDDGKIDNKLGSILKTVGSLVGDLNGTIKEQVDGGSLVILLEEKGVDDTTSDSSVSLNGFLGDPVEGTKTGAEADGMGTFTASNSSFLPGTATPLSGRSITCAQSTVSAAGAAGLSKPAGCGAVSET